MKIENKLNISNIFNATSSNYQYLDSSQDLLYEISQFTASFRLQLLGNFLNISLKKKTLSFSFEFKYTDRIILGRLTDFSLLRFVIFLFIHVHLLKKKINKTFLWGPIHCS